MKKAFSAIISFSTPWAIAFNLSAILIILAILPTDTLAKSPFKCIFKHYIFPLLFRNCPTTGIFAGCSCPACGMTRAMSRLLHGDIMGAWNYHKLVFIVFVLMVTLIVVNTVKICKEHKFFKQK